MTMSQITSIHARQILDSRGNPTVEAEIRLENGGYGRASVPSGASTGKFEVKELRDGGKAYHGKSVLRAVEQVHGEIAPTIIGMDGEDQAQVDYAMLGLNKSDSDKSPKTPLGGNSTLAVSLALAKAAANGQRVPLYRYLGGTAARVLPRPMLNVINGGRHAPNALAIQEFMLRPKGATFAEALRVGVEVFQTLKGLLADGGFSTAVGDEGGFAAELKNAEAALDLMCTAIEKGGYKPGEQVELALDVAASELLVGDKYKLEDKTVSAAQLAEFYDGLCKKYPITSIEDPFGEEDHPAWQAFTAAQKIQIIGDDLLVTSPELIRNGIAAKWANAVLIKPNQIGTLSQTLEAVRIARDGGWRVVLSHRSGDTEDTAIADIAVAVNAGQIKTGAPMRSERTAKYNRLLRIAEELADAAEFPVD